MTAATSAAVDRRLTTAGAAVTSRLLLDLWADHYPAHLPSPLACPGCGHIYSRTAPLCPTAGIIRPLLRRRYHELGPVNTRAALTYIQWADLHERHPERLSTFTAAPIPRDALDTPQAVDDAGLFDPTPYQHTGGLR
jgi:hypothetical protein